MAADDDDDWGDFVIGSTTLSHTVSLPPHTAATPHDSGSTMSGSAPGRVSSASVTPFQKPRGALPLSVFGGIEEEKEEEVERSGGEGISLDIKGAILFAHNKTIDSMKDKKDAALGVNVDDLIASLYIQAEPRNGSAVHFERSDPDHQELDSAVKLNKKEVNMSSNWNLTDQNLNNGNGVNEKKIDFDWNPLILDRNGVDLGRNDLDLGIKDKNSVGANEGFGAEEEADDGWEFKGAEPENGVGEVSKVKI